MNILLITLEYSPQKGGVASYYAGLMSELAHQGHQVKIVSEKLLYKWFWPRWLKAYFLLRAAIKKEKPDIIFVGHLLPLGTVAYLLRKRVSYCVFLHGMDILLAQKSRRKQWLTKKILLNAKIIVTNSEFTKEQVKKLEIGNCLPAGEAGKLEIGTVYPCPTISTNVLTEQIESLRRKLGLSGKKIMLTLGRVVERKGHDIVIKAMPEIIQHMPDIVYIIAGAGPYLEKLTQLVENLELQPYVRFVGQIADEERSAYYALCDIFVTPSRQIGPDVEGFGLSFIEAALFGKPSIGGKSGGVPEAILDGQTGALVDPTDVSELARAVVQLLRDDKLRYELGQNAKARAIHEFNWTKQTKKLSQLL